MYRYTINREYVFRRYGRYTYVLNRDTLDDYLFRPIVYLVLSCIEKSEKGCSEQQLIEAIEGMLNRKIDEEQAKYIFTVTNRLTGIGVLGLTVDKGSSSASSIFDELTSYCKSEHYLISAALEITYRCNENCVHCYIDEQPDSNELRYGEYCRVIDQLYDMGCLTLLITGGEPFMRDDAYDILKYATDKGFVINIYTNGYDVSDGILQKVIALKPFSISFSLYGGNPDVHDSFTRTPGSFVKSLETLTKCKNAGIATYIKSFASPSNITEIESLYRLGSNLGVEVRVSSELVESHNRTRDISQLCMNEDDFTLLYQLSEKYTGISPKRIRRGDGAWKCNAGRCAISIDPYGNVFPCNSVPICAGNVRDQSLRDIWESMRVLVSRLFPKEYLSDDCVACKWIDYCSPCLGTCIQSESGFKPSRRACLKAKTAYMYSNLM